MKPDYPHSQFECASRRARPLFFICLISLMISLVLAPFSLLFVVASSLLGLSHAALTIIGWKRRSELLAAAGVPILVVGFNILKELAFPDLSVSDSAWWWLSAEWLSLIFIMFSAALLLYRGKTEGYIR